MSILRNFACPALLLTCIALAACQHAAPQQRYPFKGKVVAVHKDQRLLTVAHESIPGYMGAMTMPFVVKDEWALNVLAPGDQVQATLVIEMGRSWLEEIVVTKPATAAPAPAASAHEPKPGDAVPDFSLVNQDGKRIHLRQFRGKLLLVTFIYTRCPLPDYCPLLSSNFAQINKALTGQAHLLSVSIDPDFDTPNVLRHYSAAYTRSFANWDFASGNPQEVRRFTEFFGLQYWSENNQIVHSLRTALISPDGRLVKLYTGNDWKPADVLTGIKNFRVTPVVPAS